MCHFGFGECVCMHIDTHTHTRARWTAQHFTRVRTPFSHSLTLRDAHTSGHVLRGVKELRCPLSQSYWAVMTLEDVGFFLSTGVI